MFGRSSAVRVRLDRDLRAFVDAQAKGMGVDRATWMRMVITAMANGRLPPLGVFAEGAAVPPHQPQNTHGAPQRAAVVPPGPAYAGQSYADPDAPPDDSWRGPVEDDDEDEAPAPARAALPAPVQRQAGSPVEFFAREPPGAANRPATYSLYEPPREFAYEKIPGRVN